MARRFARATPPRRGRNSLQRLFYGLVNGSFGDPGVYIEHGGEAALIDCGDLRPLSAARIHRVRTLCVTHAHVDHFFGFDWLFRVFLGEDRALRVFGPEGTADRVASKIAGYTWNIPLEFCFEAEVVEVAPEEDRALRTRFRLRRGLERGAPEAFACPGGVLLDARTHRLRACQVDHGTPCLAYTYEQKRGARVRDADLDRLGLARGPWLKDLKAAVLGGAPDDAPFRADGRMFRLGDLVRDVAEIVPGAKIAYVTDTALGAPVRERLLGLAHGATTLVCEAKFLERDREKAQAARHLTARDAATLARDAGARDLVLFHPSPRYERDFGEVLAEARAVFPAARFQEGPAETLVGT